MRFRNDVFSLVLQKVFFGVVMIALPCGATWAQDHDPFAPEDATHTTVGKDPFAPDPFGLDPATTKRAKSDSTAHRKVSDTAAHWEKKHRRVKALFEQPTSYEFFDTPLEDAMAFFSELHEFDCSIDTRALDALGEDSSLPIDHTMDGVSLRQSLDLILAPHDLTYVIREGIVVITSQEEAEEMLTTKLYPVRELLHVQQRHESMDLLIGVITGSVGPDSWEQAGGPGTIHAYQGILVIAQTDRTHNEIDQLLDQLHSTLSAAGGPTIPIRTKPTPNNNGKRAGHGGVFNMLDAAIPCDASQSTTE